MKDSIRKEVVFRGRVQGVGFRYTAHSLARGFEVAGYVRNLPDGSVELVAEGAREEVDGFLGALRKRMAGYIADFTENERETSGEFGGFSVAF